MMSQPVQANVARPTSWPRIVHEHVTTGLKNYSSTIHGTGAVYLHEWYIFMGAM